MRAIVCVALALGCLALSGRARAQACCTAVGSSELGVVGPRQEAVVAAQLGWDRGFGSFDQRRHYTRLRDAEVDDAILSLGGGFRPGVHALQIQGGIPLRLQHRSLTGLEPATRVGAGDASLSLRVLALEDPVTSLDASRPATWVPFLEPFVGVRAPTGRGPNDSKEPTGADVMGDGAWALFAGATLTKFFTEHHALLLSGSFAHRFPHEVPGSAGSTVRFSPGDEVDARVGYLYAPDMFWSCSLFSTFRRTGRVSYDGTEAPDTDSHRLRFGASVQHSLSYPRWQLLVSAAFDPPADGFGKNVPFASTSLTLGLQRNFAP